MVIMMIMMIMMIVVIMMIMMMIIEKTIINDTDQQTFTQCCQLQLTTDPGSNCSCSRLNLPNDYLMVNHITYIHHLYYNNYIYLFKFINIYLYLLILILIYIHVYKRRLCTRYLPISAERLSHTPLFKVHALNPFHRFQ